MSFWISGVTTVIVSCVGVVGNALSLVVLCKKVMFSMFNKLLICLCLADLLFLLSNIAVSPVSLQIPWLYNTPMYHSLECVSHFSLSTSVFLTASCTVERHQAVCCPHLYKHRLIKKGENSLLMIYVLPTIFLSLIFNIPRFISVTPLGLDLQAHPVYLRFLLMFQFFHPISTTGILPFLLLTILNFRIYRRVTSYGFSVVHKKDVHLTRILISIVITFLFLNLPRLGIGLFEISRYNVMRACFESEAGIYNYPEWQLNMDIVSRFLMVINSSVNIVIYCWSGKQFKAVLLSILTRNEVDYQSSSSEIGRDMSKFSQTALKINSFKELQVNGSENTVLTTSSSQNRETQL